MKEYINKTTGEYRKTSEVVSGEQWIEIPSDAECLTKCTISRNNTWFLFWKGNYKICVGYDDDWDDFEDVKEYLSKWSARAHILWQRPAQPEALPFVDDEPSLNDQYAEIEKVRQDVINKPNHYNGTECLDAMQKMMTHEQFIGFLRGNVFKYQWRYDKKNGLEDLKKSQWYLDKLMSLL